MPRPHDTIIKDISATIKKAASLNKKLRIYHGSTNSTRQQQFQKDNVVNTSELCRILEINTTKQTITVEPNVSMKNLFDFTFKHGLMPQVVMEFPEITVGGGIAGVSGESSSSKYGLFHEGVIEYEVVLGNGRVVIASEQKNTDLFEALPGSYGTLGVITKIKLRLVSAKKFVKLSYERVDSMSQMQNQIINKVKKKPHFMDGILFTKNLGVIMSGELMDEQNLRTSNFRHGYDEWFYIHAKNIAEKYSKYQELIPIRDYLFRYNRGAFWTGKFAFERLHIPWSRFGRFMLSPFMQTKTLYRGLQTTNISQEYLVQDYCLPSKRVGEMYKFIDSKLGIYPLWLLPIRAGDRAKFSPGYIDTNLIVNIGVYGSVLKPASVFKKLNRNLEKHLQKLGGRKVLYAHSYYSDKEFWSIHDKSWYDNLRKKYAADTVFPDIFEKISVKHTYRASVIKGAIKFFLPPYKLPLR